MSRKKLKHSLNNPFSATELVEVVDASDRPIAVLSLREAHRQRLRHRAVMVLVYNLQGKVFLQKRTQGKSTYPGRWDLSATGHVQAGESSEDAALRELQEELGIRAESLELKRRIEAELETDWEFVSLYSAGKVRQEPIPNPLELAGGYFCDAQEVACLVANFRDLLTPGLIYCWERGLIFPQNESAQDLDISAMCSLVALEAGKP